MVIPIGPFFSFVYNITESKSLKKIKNYGEKINESLDKYMKLHITV